MGKGRRTTEPIPYSPQFTPSSPTSKDVQRKAVPIPRVQATPALDDCHIGGGGTGLKLVANETPCQGKHGPPSGGQIESQHKFLDHDCKLLHTEPRTRGNTDPPARGQITSHKMTTRSSNMGTIHGPGQQASCRRQ